MNADFANERGHSVGAYISVTAPLGFNKSSLNRQDTSLKMRRKVKEKLEPLALGTVRDGIGKVRAAAVSSPEDEELRTKKLFF